MVLKQVSIVWRADSWGAACRRHQLSALQMMEMPLDAAKYGWLLNLQTLGYTNHIQLSCMYVCRDIPDCLWLYPHFLQLS